jgi:hypothetical protein
MKNLLLILLLVSLGTRFAHAQAPTITWSPEIDKARLEALAVIAADQQNIYVSQGRFGLFRGAEAHLRMYSSKDFTMKSEINLILEPSGYEKGGAIYTGAIKDKIYVFSVHTKSGERTEAIFLSQFDRLSGKTVKPATLVYESASNRDLRGLSEYTYTVVVANDSSQFLSHYPETVDKKEAQKFTFMGVSLEGKKNWSKTITMDYPEKRVDMYNWTMDGQGNVYMLSKIVPPADQMERGTANYFFQILTYDAKTGAVDEFDLDLDGKFIDGIGFKLDKSSNLWCSGFYSNRRGSRLSDGVFYIKLEAGTKKILQSELKPVADLYPENLKGRDKIDFYVNDLFFTNAGDLVMIGEQYHYYVTYTTDPNTHATTRTEHFIYNNIVAVCVKKDGGIGWIQKIGKRQHTTNDGGFYSSFSSFEQGGKIHLLFNDHRNNLEVLWGEDRIRDMDPNGSAMAVLVSIDASGKATKTQLFQGKEVDVLLYPGSVGRLDANNFVFTGVRTRNFRIGKLKF